MLIAADDALESASDLGSESVYGTRRSESDKKFGKAIELLSDFAKDFSLEDPISDLNIRETSIWEWGVTVSWSADSATTILQALKNDLHSNVKFPSVSLSLKADRILAIAL